MSVKLNFLFNAGYQVLNVVAPLISTPYISRILGAHGVGLWAYTYNIAGYFVLVGGLGMGTYAARRIAEVQGDFEQRCKQFWQLLFFQILFASLAFGCYLVWIVLHWQDYEIRILYLVWIPYVISVMVDISWYLFGMEEFVSTTVRSFTIRILELSAIFVFVKSSHDVWIYGAIISLGTFLGQIILWVLIWGKMQYIRPKFKAIFRHLKPCVILFIPVISASLYTMLDKVMLGTMTNLTEVGYYEYSEKVSKIPLAVITALGVVMLPRMTALLSSGQRELADRMICNSLNFTLYMSFAFAFGIVAVADDFVPFFLGENYTSCIPLVRMLAVLVVFISMSNVVGKQFMLPSRMDVHFTISIIIGAAANVLINLALIPQLGALGSVIATIAAEAAVLFVQLLTVRRDLNLVTHIPMCVNCLVAGIVMVITVRVLADRLSAADFGVSGILLVEVSVGAVVYVIFAMPAVYKAFRSA